LSGKVSKFRAVFEAREQMAREETNAELVPPTKLEPVPEEIPRLNLESAPIDTPQLIQKEPRTEKAPGIKLEPTSGYLQLSNHFIYDVMPTLKPSDGYVLLYLIARTHGFRQDRVIAPLETIASACHMSRTQARRCVRALAGRKLIKIVAVDSENVDPTKRGMVLEVLLPRLNSAPLSKTAPGSKFTPNKDKDLKDTNKREVASPDFKNCPDCHGTGFYYPNGVEHGVAKCRHEKLAT
jgi:hypothetical protein